MSNSSPLDYLYDEDITGSLPANKIENELHLITPAIEVGEFNFIVPKYMPFFKETMVVKHVSTGTILVPGVDWQPSHLFDSASFETEWVKGGIYGSITITNRNLTGQFQLVSYQTLGGGWIQSNDKLLEILANRIVDPRTATFEQVTGIPHVFPPTGHNHPIQDWVGAAELVSGLIRVAESVENRTQIWLDNPPILMNDYYLKEETRQVSRQIAETVFTEKVATEMGGFNQSINNLQTQLNNGLAARYTKTESDGRYYQKSETYTRAEVANLIAVLGNTVYTKTETDTRYYLKTETYTRGEVNALISNVNVAINNRYTKVEVDQLLSNLGSNFSSYYTKTESDNQYYRKSDVYTKSEADGRFVQLTRQVIAGVGLSGGGALSSNVTLRVAAGQIPTAPIDLGTTDLNTLNTNASAGFYVNYTNANATPDRNYPTELAGKLLVSIAAGIIQEYTTYGNTRQVWLRGFYNNVWSDWTQVGAATNVALGTTNLNDVVTPGEYHQMAAGNSTTARNYPMASMYGILRVERIGDFVLQNAEHFASDGNRTFKRWKLAASPNWNAWIETSVKSSTTQGFLYVGNGWRLTWPAQFQS